MCQIGRGRPRQYQGGSDVQAIHCRVFYPRGWPIIDPALKSAFINMNLQSILVPNFHTERPRSLHNNIIDTDGSCWRYWHARQIDRQA